MGGRCCWDLWGKQGSSSSLRPAARKSNDPVHSGWVRLLEALGRPSTVYTWPGSTWPVHDFSSEIINKNIPSVSSDIQTLNQRDTKGKELTLARKDTNCTKVQKSSRSCLLPKLLATFRRPVYLDSFAGDIRKIAKKTSAKIKAKISLVLKAECFCSDSDCVLLFCHLRLSQFVLERLSELPALISHCCTFLLSLALSFEIFHLSKLNIDTFHHMD